MEDGHEPCRFCTIEDGVASQESLADADVWDVTRGRGDEKWLEREGFPAPVDRAQLVPHLLEL